MRKLIPFIFEDKPVRAVVIDGADYWIGRDVARVLGYKDTVNAIKTHCRGVVKHHPIVDALGRTQEVRVIGEPDVFRLIAASRLPEAVRFEKWLFEEVLPQIRRTGSYALDRKELEALKGRVYRMELKDAMNEQMLKNAFRTISRYKYARVMTYEDKKEILTLKLNGYRISDIQRITKKGRGAITKFLDWLTDLDDQAFEAEYEKIIHGVNISRDAGRGKGGAA
jgi:prophage antirepressor-like protein